MPKEYPAAQSGGAQLRASIKSGAKILGPAAAGAAAAVAADKGRIAAESNQYHKPAGTQSGHHVTNNDNHTKPVTAADKQAEAKRPAVGNDKAVAKKVAKDGGTSWNNGYTN